MFYLKYYILHEEMNIKTRPAENFKHRVFYVKLLVNLYKKLYNQKRKVLASISVTVKSWFTLKTIGRSQRFSTISQDSIF